MSKAKDAAKEKIRKKMRRLEALKEAVKRAPYERFEKIEPTPATIEEAKKVIIQRITETAVDRKDVKKRRKYLRDRGYLVSDKGESAKDRTAYAVSISFEAIAETGYRLKKEHEGDTGKYRMYNGKFWESISEPSLVVFFHACAAAAGVPPSDTVLSRGFSDLVNGFKREMEGKAGYVLESPLDAAYSFRIPFQNTVLEFSKGADGKWDKEEKPFKHAYGLRYLLPFDYDESAECNFYDRKLKEIMEGDDAEHRTNQWHDYAAGLFVPRRVIPCEKALFMLGAGANGKTTLTTLLEAMVGDAFISREAIADLCTDKKFTRNALEGKLLNIDYEGGKRIFASEDFKRLTEGLPTTANVKGKPAYTLREIPKFIICANKLPDIADGGYSIERRVSVLEFFRTFTRDDSKVSELSGGPALDRALAEESAGIFAKRLIPGIERLLAYGGYPLYEHDRVIAATFNERDEALESWLVKFQIVPGKAAAWGVTPGETKYRAKVYRCLLRNVRRAFAESCVSNAWVNNLTHPGNFARVLRDEFKFELKAGGGNKMYVFMRVKTGGDSSLLERWEEAREVEAPEEEEA